MVKIDGLSIPQRLAISALLKGQSTAEAAAAAGVTRGTVSRWINHDSDFQAALREKVAGID